MARSDCVQQMREYQMRKHIEPIAQCKTPGCHWQGRIGGNKKARCPHCQRLLFPRNDLDEGYKTKGVRNGKK
jgi:hypothetical protein